MKKKLSVFVLNGIAFTIAYYVSILLHEYGHGTVAWLYGFKSTPFDIIYGGWALLHVDEGVNYMQLFAQHQDVAAALIGIAGPIVSFILLMIGFILLSIRKIQKHNVAFIIVYWFLIVNMVPFVQYFATSVFVSSGDTGHFIQGLHISPWIIFIPGCILVILALWRIFSVEMIKAYLIMPINSLIGRHVLLLCSLGVIFLLIYTHSYNPIKDNEGVFIDQVMAILSIIVVPVFFVIYSPGRRWVKQLINMRKELLFQS